MTDQDDGHGGGDRSLQGFCLAFTDRTVCLWEALHCEGILLFDLVPQTVPESSSS